MGRRLAPPAPHRDAERRRDERRSGERRFRRAWAGAASASRVGSAAVAGTAGAPRRLFLLDLNVELECVSPMAVPVPTIIGRERMAQGTADDQLLIEAESLAQVAMRRD